MKRILKLITLSFILCFVLTSFNSRQQNKELVTSINYTVNYGECMRKECFVEKIYNQYFLITTKKTLDKSVQNSTIDSVVMENIRWQNILKYVDLEEFKKLPGKINCSDSENIETEMIEISTNQNKYKIIFKNEARIKSIAGLLVVLRNRK